WDLAPENGPALLTAPAPRRLGLYFEALYECLLRDLLGWTVLARNLPIRQGRETLGELDLVARNPVTGNVEHHEIAVKFYLGYHHANGEALWYGPNARDRLDLKTAHLLEKQSQRRQLAATIATLQAHGIPQPQLSRIFMPGYLFYPSRINVRAATMPVPATLPANHERGRWLYYD